jgi:hypothetical protein
MAEKSMIAHYLGLTISGEQALADAFALVGLRHAVEPEMRNATMLFTKWCKAHLDALQPMIHRYGVTRSTEGQRLRRALFHGRRTGGLGLLLDYQDLITLATAVHADWSVLHQAARECRDVGLETVSGAADGETFRQISWLEMKLRQLAPQALTVPSDTAQELSASIPTRRELGAIAGLAPELLARRGLSFAPAAAAVVLLTAIALGAYLSPAHPR